jgi:acetylornithine deacetylase
VGNVRAGTWASSVAESLVFEGRYGISVDEDQMAARRSLEEAVAGAAESDPWLRDHPPVVEWWGGQFYPARTPLEHPLVQTIAGAVEDVTEGKATLEGMTYGADMGLLVNVGDTRTVLFGPGDVRVAHRPDEYVPVSELETAVRTLALTALRFCGYETR